LSNLRYKFAPIDVWNDPPTPKAERQLSPFKTDYQSTLDLLFREARMLDATLLVLQVDLKARDIRTSDGLPRSDARYGSNPGVIVSFDSRYGALRYSTDTYTDWKSNLRAIALSLEALRAVDRRGVSKRGEQYRGWTAVGSARPGQGPFTSQADAETWMRKCAAESGIINWRNLDNLYKMLAVAMHPDMPSGNRDLWERLDAAATLLGVRKNGSDNA
jgi:hypothetical protein